MKEHTSTDPSAQNGANKSGAAKVAGAARSAVGKIVELADAVAKLLGGVLLVLSVLTYYRWSTLVDAKWVHEGPPPTNAKQCIEFLKRWPTTGRRIDAGGGYTVFSDGWFLFGYGNFSFQEAHHKGSVNEEPKFGVAKIRKDGARLYLTYEYHGGAHTAPPAANVNLDTLTYERVLDSRSCICLIQADSELETTESVADCESRLHPEYHLDGQG